ncbi:MAG: multiheme c-type cytochrome [Desulfobacterales bacterium]
MHLISLGYTLLALTMTFFFQISDFAFAQQAGPGAGPGQGAGMVATTLTTFETDDFSGSGNCALCHSRLTDEAGNDVSNDAQWRSTMMANAAKDPLWQAKISSEVDRNPHVQDVIEEKCSRCHMGMARYQAMTDGTDVGALSPGFLDPAHYLHEAAMDGVSCTLCHQIQPDKLGTSNSFTGKYVIDTTTVPPNRLIFGPYDQPVQNPMKNNAFCQLLALK